MTFVRRFFYDQTDGRMLLSYIMEGDIAPGPAAVDAERIGLAEYGVLEWQDPDPEIEAQFSDPYNNQISVDVAAMTLVFGHVDVPEPEPEEPNAYKDYFDAMQEVITGV